MGYVRFLLSIAAVSFLSACAGSSQLASNGLGSNNPGSRKHGSSNPGSGGLIAGIGPNNASTVAGRSVAAKETPAATVRPVAKTTSASPADKLIALTFDDGPRPYVLFGRKADHPAPGLADIL